MMLHNLFAKFVPQVPMEIIHLKAANHVEHTV